MTGEEDLYIKPLDETWIAEIQRVFEAAPNYSQKVEGRLPVPTAAKDALLSGPPNFDMRNKFGFGFFNRDRLIGYIDIAKGYPEEGISYLGLLLIDESMHGKGLGTKAFELIQDEVRKWNCSKIRLSVAETNDVQGFWEKMGFKPTGRVLKPHQAEIVCDVIEMEKYL